jgi:hypothetical protein
MSALWRGIVLAAALALPAGSAWPANLFELNFWLSGPRYDGALPACQDAGMLGIITRNFTQKEGRFWSSDLTIHGFEDVREVAYRPWAPNAIPRRFCKALALVSDGFKHPVHYVIGETTSIIGAGFGVEWCVVGLDRNWAYNPACKMARP